MNGIKGYDIREPFRPVAEYAAMIVAHPLWWVATLALLGLWVIGVQWLIIDAILTFGATLLVFILQNTQRRDSLAMQAKLDELLRATTDARTGMAGIENKDDAKIEETKEEIESLEDEVEPINRL